MQNGNFKKRETPLFLDILKECYADFEESLGKGSGYFKQIKKYKGRNKDVYDALDSLYKTNNFLKVTPQEEPKIPKVIHQIWIGDREMPQTYKDYRKSWITHHPDWEIKLWTNKEVKEYKFSDKYLNELCSKELTIGEMVDILRYDILYTLGGLYVDCDCFCLKPHDVLHHCYDFYAGIFPPFFSSAKSAINISNGMIGSKKNHPIFPILTKFLYDNWDNVKGSEDDVYTTLKHTFTCLTEPVIEGAGRDNNVDIVLPTGYFFPLTPYPLFDIIIRGPFRCIIDFITKQAGPFSSIKPYSFSVHHSGKEWMHDIYSTINLKNFLWLVFTPRDWKLLIKSKFFKKKEQPKKTRMSFKEMLNDKHEGG